VQPADKALLESWAVDANSSKGNEVGTRRSRKGRASALGTDEDQENLRAQKRKKAEYKKHTKWQSLGYHSLAIDDPGDRLQPDSSGDESSNDIHFVIGDCTQPVTSSPDEPCIILSYTSFHFYALFLSCFSSILHYSFHLITSNNVIMSILLCQVQSKTWLNGRYPVSRVKRFACRKPPNLLKLF